LESEENTNNANIFGVCKFNMTFEHVCLSIKSSVPTIHLPDEGISEPVHITAPDLPVNPRISPTILPGPTTILPMNTPINIARFVYEDSVLPTTTVQEHLKDAKLQLEEEMKNLVMVWMLLVQANDSIHRSMLVKSNLSHIVLNF
jgi:hypothetical protein